MVVGGVAVPDLVAVGEEEATTRGGIVDVHEMTGHYYNNVSRSAGAQMTPGHIAHLTDHSK